jgi:hypothetical protein
MAERLCAEWESRAEYVREIEAAGGYRDYWRGYATALDLCAKVLRARAQKEARPDIWTSSRCS